MIKKARLKEPGLAAFGQGGAGGPTWASWRARRGLGGYDLPLCHGRCYSQVMVLGSPAL